MILNPAYRWLEKENSPLALKEAISLYGVKEFSGEKHNPEILRWACEVNKEVLGYYKADEIPWCGLFVAVCLKRAGWIPPKGYDALRALKYSEWGAKVKSNYCIGDIGVFERSGGGHVGFLVGQDVQAFHVLGGNQGNEVNVSRITKDRLHAAVRPQYKTFAPRGLPNLSPYGALSKNEA